MDILERQVSHPTYKDPSILKMVMSSRCSEAGNRLILGNFAQFNGIVKKSGLPPLARNLLQDLTRPVS